MSHHLSHSEASLDAISNVLNRIFNIEEFVERLEQGMESAKYHFEWKMIQLDDDNEVGRENLNNLFQQHLEKLEEEREKKVCVILVWAIRNLESYNNI